MSLPISTQALADMPKINPNDSGAFLDADLLFCSGNDLASLAIEKGTDSIFSHVGILWWFNRVGQWHVIEAVEDAGVHQMPLSMYLNNYGDDGGTYPGSIVIARCKGLTSLQAERAIDFGLGEEGKNYDKQEIADIIAHMILRLPTIQENGEEWICSELVWAAFNKAGIQLHQNQRGFVAPRDLFLDPRIYPIGTIVINGVAI
jgi:uncharacterized protein YycO